MGPPFLPASLPPFLPPRAVITTNKTTTKAAADRRLQARVFDYQEERTQTLNISYFQRSFYFYNTFLTLSFLSCVHHCFLPTAFFLSMFTLLYECLLRLSFSFFISTFLLCVAVQNRALSLATALVVDSYCWCVCLSLSQSY